MPLIHFYHTSTDLPTATNIRNLSTCLTSLNISWDASNSITCGGVSYEVSISPPSIEGNAVTTTVDRFYSVTGLNNSLPNVTVTVTARNRAGQGGVMMYHVQLPKPLGKCYMHNCTSKIFFCRLLRIMLPLCNMHPSN